MPTQQEIDDGFIERESQEIAQRGTVPLTNQDELEDQSTGHLGQGVRNALRLILLWRQRRTVVGDAMRPFPLEPLDE